MVCGILSTQRRFVRNAWGEPRGSPASITAEHAYAARPRRGRFSSYRTNGYRYDVIDPAAVSHILAGLIGAMSIGAAVLLVGAFFSLGRSGYRKD